MKFYELTYLISPDLSEEEANAFQDKITSQIQQEGGVLNEVKHPIREQLAFAIKKKRSAYLSSLSFQLAPEKLENLEKKLKEDSQILRYLILIKSPIKEVIIPSRKGSKLKEVLPEVKKPRTKVELKEIEKKLEEILGE